MFADVVHHANYHSASALNFPRKAVKLRGRPSRMYEQVGNGDAKLFPIEPPIAVHEVDRLPEYAFKFSERLRSSRRYDFDSSAQFGGHRSYQARAIERKAVPCDDNRAVHSFTHLTIPLSAEFLEVSLSRRGLIS
jgi:hypothetical protein